MTREQHTAGLSPLGRVGLAKALSELSMLLHECSSAATDRHLGNCTNQNEVRQEFDGLCSREYFHRMAAVGISISSSSEFMKHWVHATGVPTLTRIPCAAIGHLLTTGKCTLNNKVSGQFYVLSPPPTCGDSSSVGHTHAMLQLKVFAPVAFALLTSTQLLVSAQQCYYPDGSAAPDVPCNSSAPVSACCTSFGFCLCVTTERQMWRVQC